jgi:hypothetical protein
LDEGGAFVGFGEGVYDAGAAMNVDGSGCLGGFDDEVPGVARVATDEEDWGLCVVFLAVGLDVGGAKADVFEEGMEVGAEGVA